MLRKIKKERCNFHFGRANNRRTNIRVLDIFFDVPYYRILKGAPTKAFKYLPAGYGRKDISNTLFEIREFRNRIFHNEPVCFVNNKIDFSYARSIYASIINILVWIDPKIKTSLLEIDRVLKVIDDEERKQNNP